VAASGILSHDARRRVSAHPGSPTRLGDTVIIVTHDMKVAETCERAIGLRDGRIVRDLDRRAGI
jgi:predicted ABC-type transport system involved in lysophospholipase L1 biosynthesis ATPase subunit